MPHNPNNGQVILNTADGITRQKPLAFQLGEVDTPGVDDVKFLKALHERHHLKTGILPPVVRWMSQSKHYVILERPPMMQTVTFHAAKPDDMEGATEHTFSLPIPWTLYAIEIGSNYYPEAVSCYSMRGPIRSARDVIGILPLPNHYNSGGICLPPYRPVPCENLAQGINAAYQLAWHSGFNHDLNQAIKFAIALKRPHTIFGKISGRITALKMFKQWAKLDLEEVLEINDWTSPSGYGSGFNYVAGAMTTVNHLINRLQVKDAERMSIEASVIGIRTALAEAAL